MGDEFGVHCGAGAHDGEALLLEAVTQRGDVVELVVACVAPGCVKTPMLDRLELSLTPEQFTAVESIHPLGLGTPRDVANGIAFLLADTPRWITGGCTAHRTPMLD